MLKEFEMLNNSSCKSFEFKCLNSSQCILKSFVCDQNYDCLDNSDEENCSNYHYIYFIYYDFE